MRMDVIDESKIGSALLESPLVRSGKPRSAETARQRRRSAVFGVSPPPL
jgi:hypothetical protein